MRTCIDCGETKALTEFYVNTKIREGYKPNAYYSSYCKLCDRKRSKIAKSKPAYREAQNAKKRAYSGDKLEMVRLQKRINTKKNYVGTMLSRAKKRAKERNLPFNITREDVVIPELCPLLQIPLMLGTKGDYETTPSLDRIEPSLGYVKGNVWVISKKANSMKNSASLSELYTFCKNAMKLIKSQEDIVRATENKKSVEIQDKELV